MRRKKKCRSTHITSPDPLEHVVLEGLGLPGDEILLAERVAGAEAGQQAVVLEVVLLPRHDDVLEQLEEGAVQLQVKSATTQLFYMMYFSSTLRSKLCKT